MAETTSTPADARTSLGRMAYTRLASRQHPTSSPDQDDDAQQSPPETTRGATSPLPLPLRRRHEPDGLLGPAAHDSSDDDDEILVPMGLSALTRALLSDRRPGAGGSEYIYAIPGTRPAPASSPDGPPRRARTEWESAAARRHPSSPAHSPADTRLAAASSASGERGDSSRGWARGRGMGESPGTGGLQASTSPSEPASPVTPRSARGSPAAGRRVVRLIGKSGYGSNMQNRLGSPASATEETGRGSTRDSAGGEWHSQPRVGADRWSPRQDGAQDMRRTPGSPMRTVWLPSRSTGPKMPSAGSSSGASKRFGVTGDGGTPEEAAAADGLGSVPRGHNSSRRADLEIRSTTRPKRVIRVPGSLLGGPARRGQPRQAGHDGAANAEETDSAPRSQAAQGSMPAAMYQPAMALSPPRDDSVGPGSPRRIEHVVPVAISKTSRIRELASNVRSSASRDSESPHLEQIPLRQTPPASTNFHAPASESLRQVLLEPDRGNALVANTRHTTSQPPPSMAAKIAADEIAIATQPARKRQLVMKVNGRAYTKIDCIGRGGSGKVYRVATKGGTMLALKRVSLAHMDEHTENGLMREIELLQRLRNVERVIHLIDFEVNKEKQSLCVLMQVGELDFNTLLKNRQNGTEAPRFDITFVRYYWREMLECVRAIHAHAVVHSDLKPANFVLVSGRLKLIDFGIANAIQTDTTINVHRETMAGTPNFMSPESLMDSSHYAFLLTHDDVDGPAAYRPERGAAKRVVKVGRPSDVWSLGCILYQMVYGLPPFGAIAEPRARIRAIVDWSHAIEFPATAGDGSRVPGPLVETMRRCLSRDQSDRPTCEALLSEADGFLYPREGDGGEDSAVGQVVPLTEELLGRVIQSVVLRCREGPADDVLDAWPGAYWAGLKKVQPMP